MSDNYFVAIAGNIGVGKTTMTELISKKLNWEAFYEPVINNPYLDDFYENMNKWSFHLQIYFLSKRFELQKQIFENNISCIQDRTIYEDAEIFARTLYEKNFMTERDFKNYQELFKNMTYYLRTPNLIVYLRASVNQLQKRIQDRGRESEKSISRDYLAKLNEAYENWIPRVKKLTHVITIQTEHYTKKNLKNKPNGLLKKSRNSALFLFLKESNGLLCNWWPRYKSLC